MIPLGITEENTLQEEKLKVQVTDLFILLTRDTQTSVVNKAWTNRQNNHTEVFSWFWTSSFY